MSTKITLDTPVKNLFLVGPTYSQRLQKLGILTINDLLYHLPFRYDDFRLISPLNRLQAGETVTVRGRLESLKNQYTKNNKKIQTAIIADQSGRIEAIWFNQTYLAQTLKVGSLLYLSGQVDWWGNKVKMISPQFELVSRHPPLHTGRLVPIYSETARLSSKWLRSRIYPLMQAVVSQIDDWLPKIIREKYHLLDLPTALKMIHFPENYTQSKVAKKRLAFEEMFFIHLQTLQRKETFQQNHHFPRFKINRQAQAQFIQSLPFQLTSAQKKAIQEIFSDLSSGEGMNRLLQGDVGSGKTVVAATAILCSHLNGYSSVFMAPTQILAQQHYDTLKKLFKKFNIKTQLITASTKLSKSKDQRLTTNVYIGTHALLFHQKNFLKLGLVVIDEQHRFGVHQRAHFFQNKNTPHLLTLTATPIPRTVALTLYGDLRLSVLDEMPPHRLPVKTWIVPPEKRNAAYHWIAQQIRQNQSQAFFVCPLIEESLKESLKDVRAATAEFSRLKKIFPQLKLGLLHGRLKKDEKNGVLKNFRENRLQILVATPVVEVGIDIPNASIILIEAAERFGLAQLHQLRGRVGRNAQESYCFLFSESDSEKSLKRLSYLAHSHHGAQLAEYDLNLRGPGEILGIRQHGFQALKAASFADLALIKTTQAAAKLLFPRIEQFPLLKKKLSECKIETTITS